MTDLYHENDFGAEPVTTEAQEPAFNPYAKPLQPENVEPKPVEPRPFAERQPQGEPFPPQPYRQSPQPPQPPQRPVTPGFPPNQPPQRPYPPTYSNRPAPPARNSRGAAKAFGMVSFLIGCFILPITSMIFFNFRSSVGEKFGAATFWSIVLSVPALVFGVVSLMKKPEKRLFPILGIAFAGVLLLCAFITYFFMVNTAPDYHSVIY